MLCVMLKVFSEKHRSGAHGAHVCLLGFESGGKEPFSVVCLNIYILNMLKDVYAH